MTSASSVNTPRRVTTEELSAVALAPELTSAVTPTIAPTAVVRRPGPSPPYQALSVTAPRKSGKSPRSTYGSSGYDRSHATAEAAAARR
jgi:hypothetical protein